MNNKKIVEKIEEGKIEKFGLTEKIYNSLKEPTPARFIKKRPGRGGLTFEYVETGYVTDFLNRKFNCMWSFEVIDKQVGKEKVWVLGKLTVYIPTRFGIQPIIKSQFGGADIKKDKITRIPIDIGDDLKSAASDALKKCASLFGIASDIYWRET